MNILFITSNRLGDAVLSTGLLHHLTETYPQARVTVACGRLPAPLFKGVPGLEDIIELEKRPLHGHWLSLWAKVFRKRWDIVVDLRDSAVSRVICAKERHIFSRDVPKDLHKAGQIAAVMGLYDVPAPRLWVTEDQAREAARLVPGGETPILAIGPTANWIGKTWPAANFIELVQILTGPEGIMPGARVAVFAAPGEEAPAQAVLESVPEGRRIDMIARGDTGIVAAALSRCDFYIGNDSGLMHCADAAGIPTLGLFGPSYPALYAPWGDNGAFVSTPETFDELTAFEGYDPNTLDRSLMTSLGVSEVAAAAENLWRMRAQLQESVREFSLDG